MVMQFCNILLDLIIYAILAYLQLIKQMETFEKSKWVSFKKETIHPLKRWGHTSTIIGDQLYLFGGKLQQQSKKSTDSFYQMNCSTFEFKKIELPSMPDLRDSHLAFSINNKLYIWGGVIKQMVTNDCYIFDGNSWSKVEQKGNIPKPRQSPVATVRENYVLMYGGCHNQTVYEDFNLFDTTTHTWYPVATLNKISKRQNSTLTTLGNNLYMFGGQTDGQKQQKFFNDLYKISLHTNLPSVQIRIQSVKAKNQVPCHRSCHCTVGYSGRYLIVLGGLTYSISKDDALHILGDVWSFDTVQLLWREIKIANPTLFKKHANFSAELYNQNIIIFGGLKSTTNWNSYDDLLVLQLFDLEEFKLDTTCNNCKLPFTSSPPLPCPQQDFQLENQQTKIQNLNLRTIYKTSQLISHPFYAIGVLIKSSLMIKSTEILIKFEEISKRKVLSIFDNGLIIDRQQFQNILFDSSIPKPSCHPDGTSQYIQSIKQYSNSLKYGCFKLSQSFLIVHTNQVGNMAAVMTPQSSYYYNIYFNQRYYEADGNSYQKFRDYAMVNSIFKHIGETHHSNCNSKKILFNLTCDGKRSNHQLITLKNDILLKRIVDLQSPGESLKEFISDFFLQPIAAKIYVNEQEVKIWPKVVLHEMTFPNGVFVGITKTDKCYFTVYHRGLMVGRFTNLLYKRGGIVIIPDGWSVDQLGLGIGEEVDYLQQLVSYVLSSHK